uniref:Uncharacterized protein n=1 Tax=Tetraselmis chuii TaxID=63592 RepID=A0A7S1SMF0_9CHLO
MVYIREMPEFVGRRHKEIWRAFNDAVVTGYLHDKSKNCVPCDLSFTLSEGQATKSDRLVLNPHEDYIMQPGDKMVVVSRNAKRVTEKVPVPPKRDEAELCEAPPFSLDLNCSHCSETEIVLISCDSVLDTILHSITEFALQKATVTVLVQPECEEQSHIPELIKDCREKGIELRVLKGDWCSEQVLYDAGVHTCSSIVLGSKFQDDVDEEHDHDAQLVSQLLLIKRTREEAYVRHAMTDPGCGEGKPLHVVGLSTYKDTQTLADVLSMSTLVPITVDLLNLDELMSGWITQVATQPAVAYFFREILATSLGCEIYVRKAVNYFPDTARDSEEAATSFRTIQEGARLHSETAIGFIQKGSRKVLLGAMANATVTLDDRVVVVAED